MTAVDPAAPCAVRVLPYGRAAVLVEAPDARATADLHAALLADPAPGTAELVPAARTVLIRFDPAVASAGRIGEHLRAVLRRAGGEPVWTAPPATEPAAAQAMAAGPAAAEPVVIEVVYDGEDLSALSRELGRSPQEIIARHAAGAYRCAFCGFAPGFSYLVGLDPALHARRLAEPRVRVPGGAVAIAGEFAAVYPAPSPGGWRLLGHTDAPMWDARRPAPALAPPGALVRFAPIRASARGSSAR